MILERELRGRTALVVEDDSERVRQVSERQKRPKVATRTAMQNDGDGRMCS